MMDLTVVLEYLKVLNTFLDFTNEVKSKKSKIDVNILRETNKIVINHLNMEESYNSSEFKEQIERRIEQLKKKHDSSLEKKVQDVIDRYSKNEDKAKLGELIINEIHSHEDRKDDEIQKEILSLLDKKNSQRKAHFKKQVELLIDSSQKGKLVEKELDNIKKSVLFCKRIYPQSKLTWNLIENKFPHLQEEEINEIVEKLYGVINEKISDENNIAFVKFDGDDNMNLELIELKYIMKKSAKKK